VTVTPLPAGLDQRPLTDHDLPALSRLAAAVIGADGGQPDATRETFLRQRYLGDGRQSIGLFAGDELVAAAAVRPRGDTRTGTAMVAVGWRGRGIGAFLLDWQLDDARGTDTESVTQASEELFASRGLRPVFGELVMRRALSEPLPAVPLPAGITVAPWTSALAERFHATYVAAFRERPGFPDWPAAQWVEWVSGDDDFRPQYSLLATANRGADAGPINGAGGADVGLANDAADVTRGADAGSIDGAIGFADAGFIVAADGFVVQVGTVPAWRGRGLGAALVVEALRRMAADGSAAVVLDVNVDNPAADLYRRLGFTVIGRRGRFDRLAGE
jgi:ribosomal protein S18 acetylase RimI-like enzyme